jgi:hypothetical protein
VSNETVGVSDLLSFYANPIQPKNLIRIRIKGKFVAEDLYTDPEPGSSENKPITPFKY